jgi:hypothetical protein
LPIKLADLAAQASLDEVLGMDTHLSLGKEAPLVRPIQRFGNIAATPIVGGLHQNTAGRSIQQGQGIGSRRS